MANYATLVNGNTIQTGHYSNAETNYFAAPQTTNDDGVLIGHSHIVIEAVPNYLSESPLDPVHFTFFKAMNAAAVDGVLSVEVTNGIGPGIYRLSSVRIRNPPLRDAYHLHNRLLQRLTTSPRWLQ